jgi:hypothetical protein
MTGSTSKTTTKRGINSSGVGYIFLPDDNEILIWGSSFLSPQALILVNSGWMGLLAIASRPLFAALEAAVGVVSLGVLAAYKCRIPMCEPSNSGPSGPASKEE